MFEGWIAGTEGWAANRSPSESPDKDADADLPESWAFEPSLADNHTLSSIEAVELDPPYVAPLLSDDQYFPALHGNFKSSHPWKEQISPQWVRVRTIMDSGAAKSIAPPSMATGVRD